TREGDNSPCSEGGGGGGRPRTPPGRIGGGLRGVGVTGGRSPPYASPPRSPARRSPLRSELSVGKAKEVGVARGCGWVEAAVRPSWSPTGAAAARAPTLKTRGSSGSTVGLTDSPQTVPEGLKTDEEDYSGCWRRPGASVGSMKPLSLARPAVASAVAAAAAAAAAPAGGGRHAGGVGGDDDSRGGMEVESEAGRTVVTATENSAGAARVSSGVAATDAAAGGRTVGSLLDAYREPEGHDWGELEDWHGLPGLQLAGGGGRATIRPRLQAPALIFRAGTVDEGDVLSLHGRPRSRKPEAESPAKYGPTAATATHPSAHESGAASAEQYHAERHARSGVTSGEETGAAVPGPSGGPRVSHPRPIRPAGGAGGGGGGVDLCFDGGDVGVSSAAVERGGGGWVSRSGGGQPLLLSLADLTTAGLQKLLQAEGGSKMFFDPDSQRWVGEEVDLSGFEDPNTSSIGSASAACAAAAAAAAQAAGAGGGTGQLGSPHRSDSRSPRSPGRIRTPSPRYVRQGAESPRLPIHAHRRWSSGEGLYCGGANARQPSVILLEGGGKAATGRSGGRASGHSRRHSVSGPALLPLGGVGARLEAPAEEDGGASRPSSASAGRSLKGRGRPRPDSM
ncbi:unnamed protein product, partial [Hapterophycus canaliculatus]